MKVKLFTHTDLDGVGCAVVGKTVFKDIDVEYCDYQEINEKVKNFLEQEEYRHYNRIFITDISVNEEVANIIDSNFNIKNKLQLVDHHGTALWLDEKYPTWCHVRTEETNLYKGLEGRDKVKASGTSLFFKFLRDKVPGVEFSSKLKSFVEVVRRYDTWEWHNVYKEDHPKRVNDLLYLIGREKFVERFVSQPITVFTDSELMLLEVEQHRINKYIWKKKQDVQFATIKVNGKLYEVAYVFADQYSSLLGNAIAEEQGGKIDFVALIDLGSNKVSLRGIHNEDVIDLGKDIAKHFGGGGHPKASGFELNNKFASEIFLKAFGQED